MDPAPTIRVMIVDDHAVVRSGLAAFLMVFDDLELVGQAESGKQAVQSCVTLKPDVVLMDMVMPEMDGNELVLWLMEQQYDSNLIIMTGYNPDYAKDARLLAEFKGLRSVITLIKPIRLDKLREVLAA